MSAVSQRGRHFNTLPVSPRERRFPTTAAGLVGISFMCSGIVSIINTLPVDAEDSKLTTITLSVVSVASGCAALALIYFGR